MSSTSGSLSLTAYPGQTVSSTPIDVSGQKRFTVQAIYSDGVAFNGIVRARGSVNADGTDETGYSTIMNMEKVIINNGSVSWSTPEMSFLWMRFQLVSYTGNITAAIKYALKAN